MEKTVACFAASRYWRDGAELEATYQSLCQALAPLATQCRLIVDGVGVDSLAPNPGDTLVVIPLSGAVQKDILRAAALYQSVTLYAAYIRGNAQDHAAERMLTHNAAPTLMDSWSVLRKGHPRALLALTQDALARHLRTLAAFEALKGQKLLLIGEPEPWVISVSRDLAAYRKLGIEIEQIPQQEIKDLYAATTEAESREYYEKYTRGAKACVEPTPQDLQNAARMTAALLKALARHGADGMAIACFDLLSVGTNACLGVSYINDCTDKIAACEGDLDSAVTMMMLKRLTDTKVWMANPGLHPQGVVNFSHCTAPLAVDGASDCPFTLRSHHESGIGASLEVEMPSGVRLSACRISGAHGVFTAQGAMGDPGPRESCCRTQLYVRFDDFDRYIRTALGCHQVFCFEDVTSEFARLAGWMGLVPEQP